jgi:acyl-CoA dehydrogenase
VYSIVGEKRYITAGVHPLTKNTVYIVLGRVEGATRSSLSMSAFLVPRYWAGEDGSLGDNHVKCLRVEDKMGLSGCPNTHLRFGEGGVTRGYLLGNRANVGLLQMQMLMRKARIGTGQLALAMASSAYLHSLRYARRRIQGPRFDQSSNPSAPRVAIIEHLDVQRMLLEMKAKVEGCRSLLLKISVLGTKLQQVVYEQGSRDGAEARRYAGLALMLSPVAKAYASDEAWNIATLAIQVHGVCPGHQGADHLGGHQLHPVPGSGTRQAGIRTQIAGLAALRGRCARLSRRRRCTSGSRA